jgi:RNA chaperone Hfq
MHSQRALLPLSQPQSAPPASPAGENAHAEISYLQKQIQAQTPMRIVLLDGEQLEGCIEWYDRTSIKIRGRQRVLVYKAAIKYLYKDADGHGGLHLARGL